MKFEIWKKNWNQNILCKTLAISSRLQWVKVRNSSLGASFTNAVYQSHGWIITSITHYGMWSLIHVLKKWFCWIAIDSLRPRQNRHHFAEPIFKCIFLNENIMILIKIDLSLFQESNKQYFSISSDNGLAPSRRHAIIWTNDGSFTDAYMHHSASMSWS